MIDMMNMINIIYIIIILYIIIQTIFDDNNINTIYNNNKIYKSKFIKNKNNKNVIYYDNPDPWTKLIINNDDDYPYHYYIKLFIPSLNDYNNWKQLIPNLNFDSLTNEIIIPSKDEASALVLANLICSNFMGQITLSDIIKKNLIEISINKCKNYEIVDKKIREQLRENLYGKNIINTSINYEIDTDKLNDDIKNDDKINDDIIHNDIINDNSFSNDFQPFDGNDYSYI